MKKIIFTISFIAIIFLYGDSFSGTFKSDYFYFDPDQFLVLDKLIRNIPKYYEKNVDTLADYLSKFPSTDLERARAIYVWIAQNITYDMNAYLTKNYGDLSPQGVLKSRKTVCSGYANLFNALASKMGVKSKIISGYAKGYGYKVGDKIKYKSNHAWNAVMIDNYWYLVDSTWGAGNIDDDDEYYRGFSELYFCSKPSFFINSHFPEEKKWQLLDDPISFDEFLDLPYLYSSFYYYGIKINSHNQATINAGSELEVSLIIPKDVILSANIEYGGYSDRELTFIYRDNNIATILCQFPSAGKYKLNIYAKIIDDNGNYNGIMAYNIIAKSGVGKYSGFPTTYNNYNKEKIRIYDPLKKYLKIGSSTYFKVSVPRALNIAVVINGKWSYLKKYGNYYTGNINISGYKIGLFAQFPNNNKYEGIAEYSGY